MSSISRYPSMGSALSSMVTLSTCVSAVAMKLKKWSE
jgi:hypothetical protein